MRALRPLSTGAGGEPAGSIPRGALDCRNPIRLSRHGPGGRPRALRVVSRAPYTAVMEGTRLAEAGAGSHLRLPLLDRIPGLAHGFTVKGTDPFEAIRLAAGRPLPLAT